MYYKKIKKNQNIIKKDIHTILDILRWANSQFNFSHLFYGHGTDNVWDEALHLILPSIGLPINTPISMYHAKLTQKELKLIIKLINLRIYKRIPVPYLTNTAWFCGLEFYVDKRVFIPRSPIGELIISHFHNLLPYPPKHILDMCTGSGCIAITSAIFYPKAEVDAVDISIEALKIAEYNIQLYNLENRVFPINSNLFQHLPMLKYDLIIINPPYVNKSDIPSLPKEFLHEPMLALSADCNGLGIIHRIFTEIINYLNINGILICEIGITKYSLIQYYPNVPFYWFNLKKGGTGVFALTYQQLLSLNKHYNKSYY